MNSTREFQKIRHTPLDKIARHGVDRHADCGGHVLSRNQNAGVDDPLEIPVCVGAVDASDEVNNSGVYFYSGEPSAEYIWHKTRLDQWRSRKLFLLSHNFFPKAAICQGQDSAKNLRNQYALQNALIIQRPKPEGQVSSDYRADKPEAVCNYEFNHRGTSPSLLAAKRGDLYPRTPRTSYDASSRRNLAGNAIVVARSLIQRAYSLRSNQVKDPTTDRTEALPGIVGLSAFRFGPHVEQSIMRGSASGQIQFAKGASHV